MEAKLILGPRTRANVGIYFEKKYISKFVCFTNIQLITGTVGRV